ncbi:MAG: transcriptional regulator [Anaerolineae bacterium]|nr:transcriptional regulator [Anaerolineae bacterium]
MQKHQQFIRLRSKKLGVLLFDARQYAQKSIEECAKAIGVSPDQYQQYENGEAAPSLPEIEAIAYHLKIPLSHFWGHQSISETETASKDFDIPRLKHLRNRIIGAMLRSEREARSLSIDDLSARVHLPTDKLAQYEEGSTSIPLPELELLIKALDKSIQPFLDQKSFIGLWQKRQKMLNTLEEFPEEMQDFLCQPVNQPYIELAMRLNSFSADKLRSIAESILQITY